LGAATAVDSFKGNSPKVIPRQEDTIDDASDPDAAEEKGTAS
jgi:hypothetical protein